MSNVPVSPINPAHYRQGKWEVIELIEDYRMDFVLGNATKYIARAGKKEPDKLIEDLNKALWYLDRILQQCANGNRRHYGFVPKIGPHEFCKSAGVSEELSEAINCICTFAALADLDFAHQKNYIEYAITHVKQFIKSQSE